MSPKEQALARIYNQLCTVSCCEWQWEHFFHKSSSIRWLLLKMPSLEYHVLKVSGTQNVNPEALTFYSQLHPCVSDTVYPQCSAIHITAQADFTWFTAIYSVLENETYQLHLINQIFSSWIVHNYRFMVSIWAIRYEAKTSGVKDIGLFPPPKCLYVSFYLHIFRSLRGKRANT